MNSPGELNELADEKVALNEALELSNDPKNIEADKLATAEIAKQKLSQTNQGELKGVSEEAKELSDASSNQQRDSIEPQPHAVIAPAPAAEKSSFAGRVYDRLSQFMRDGKFWVAYSSFFKN